MADRVGVLRAGRVAALGTPQRLWEDPGTEFVARLLGHPNVLDPASLITAGLLPSGVGGGAATVLVPVTAVTIEPSPDGSAEVTGSTYRGGHWDTTATLGATTHRRHHRRSHPGRHQGRSTARPRIGGGTARIAPQAEPG